MICDSVRFLRFGLQLFLGIALCLLPLIVLAGCSSKAITKARSEILKDSDSEDSTALSVDEERELFNQEQETQKNRLLQLVRRRSEGDGVRDGNYRLGPQDEIEINVFDVPELNLTARINQSGFVSLPLVGAVKAAGLSELDFRDELRGRLAQFVRNPQVSVFISNYGSEKVAVMGAVSKPGTYPLKKGSNSILELLSEAGGLTDRAGSYVNFIPAELSGVKSANDAEARARFALASDSNRRLKESAVEIPLDSIMGTTGGIPVEVPLIGGDMLVIPDAGKVTVEGEVQTVGSYELGNRTTLLGALGAAGGITYSAKVDEVEIVRTLSGGEVGHYIVDLARVAGGEERDIPLRNGDLIRVPSDEGKRLTQDTFEGITKLINFGIGGSVNLMP